MKKIIIFLLSLNLFSQSSSDTIQDQINLVQDSIQDVARELREREIVENVANRHRDYIIANENYVAEMQDALIEFEQNVIEIFNIFEDEYAILNNESFYTDEQKKELISSTIVGKRRRALRLGSDALMKIMYVASGRLPMFVQRSAVVELNRYQQEINIRGRRAPDDYLLPLFGRNDAQTIRYTLRTDACHNRWRGPSRTNFYDCYLPSYIRSRRSQNGRIVRPSFNSIINLLTISRENKNKIINQIQTLGCSTISCFLFLKNDIQQGIDSVIELAKSIELSLWSGFSESIPGDTHPNYFYFNFNPILDENWRYYDYYSLNSHLGWSVLYSNYVSSSSFICTRSASWCTRPTNNKSIKSVIERVIDDLSLPMYLHGE